MLTTRSTRFCLLAAVPFAVAWAGQALAQDCKPRTTAVAGTLASPDGPCPPAVAKAKPQHQSKPKQPEGFWSVLTIGGSVSTTTTIRGR